MAKLLQEKDTTVQNTLTKWGQKSLRSVYRDCLYTTHEIDGMEFDWRKLMTLFASGWTVEKLADEFSCEEEQILRVLEIFTGIKPLR